MQTVYAYSTFALTVGLVIARPRLSRAFRIGPATAGLAGVIALLLFGVVGLPDLRAAVALLWRPIIGIASIMVTTTVAERLGVLAWLTAVVEARARGSAQRLFALVYVLGAVTSAVMNNDAAVLILTPVVVSLVRRAYPGQPQLAIPFAFAVFMSAGVAPLVVSNPMNMVIASYAGLGFNAYAALMLPISLAGSLVTYAILWRLFRSELRAVPDRPISPPVPRLAPRQAQMLALLCGSLVAYPIVAYFGGPVWICASVVAALAVGLARHHRAASARQLVTRAVAWNILVFLVAACVIAFGLRNVGVVRTLASLYHDAGAGTIGLTSAVGSALLNNHPMSLLNILAIANHPDPQLATLAALVGGDLGPRLLPIGSLAGLLWLESLHRQGVHLSVRRFILVGLIATLPTLAVSLLLLVLRG